MMKIVVVHATCDFRLPLIRTKGGLLLQHEVLFVDVVTASRLAPRVSGRNPSLHPASRDARLDLSIQEDRPHSATFLSLTQSLSIALHLIILSYHDVLLLSSNNGSWDDKSTTKEWQIARIVEGKQSRR